MKRTRRSRASHGAAAAAGAAVLLLASACGGGGDPAAQRAAVLSYGANCSGTSTHVKHINQFACETCHPLGGEFGFSGTLPGGMPVTGTFTRTDGVPSCAVSCHAPDGGTPQPISWGAGPTTCGSCHVGRALVTGGSAHVPSADRARCEGCHDVAEHMGGAVRLIDGMQPGTDATCQLCHSGNGVTLASAAGPLLVGWQEAAGDWHGARAGTGYGGTLRPPYARGEAALPCRTCHGAHASPNAFLFAGTVNGVTIPAGAIGRAGVGAEVLCNACHEGDRHAQCKSCHTAVKLIIGDGFVWFDSSAPPVDPAPPGYPCFWCHGHEGIVNWTQPGSITDNMMVPWNESCDHCHNFGAPAVETLAPVVVNGGPVTATGIGATGATITWQTDERSTTQVDYGVTTAGRVATGEPGWAHSVTLTGLTPGTTYVYRVRSSDQYRNAMVSSLATFTTLMSNAPLAPVLMDTPGQRGLADEFDFVMQWYPVTAPDGDPVEYRMVMSEYQSLTPLIIDTGWIGATSYTATLSTHGTGGYYWRVMARDAVHDIRSPWSSVDDFYSWDDRE